ncbi:LysE family translocator [Achromobacter xylosoxidans]|uniref:LysE family translocator n=1 Tax=Alcaligenes xylosoxydans xylosoxydans TaxID=85698 RepID=UPI0022B889CD|nr:LysE family translocator [Achromobacter xylosoxidans]MCZ8390176.1 LysE family translocator [Achromobacter xylosoxidans]
MNASHLAMVYGTYLIATASPGPSTMAIMATAMRDGRGPALALAAGVVTGSLFWALLAATGIAAVLNAYAQALALLKIAGGLYLLYLAARTGRSALRPVAARAAPGPADSTRRLGARYRQGVFMHVGNPKAIMAWTAIISLGMGPDGAARELPAIVGGCVALGVGVFGGYALLFSTASMAALYARARRAIEGALAAVFAAAGLKLLFSRG